MYRFEEITQAWVATGCKRYYFFFLNILICSKGVQHFFSRAKNPSNPLLLRTQIYLPRYSFGVALLKCQCTDRGYSFSQALKSVAFNTFNADTVIRFCWTHSSWLLYCLLLIIAGVSIASHRDLLTRTLVSVTTVGIQCHPSPSRGYHPQRQARYIDPASCNCSSGPVIFKTLSF